MGLWLKNSIIGKKHVLIIYDSCGIWQIELFNNSKLFIMNKFIICDGFKPNICLNVVSFIGGSDWCSLGKLPHFVRFMIETIC